MIRTLLFIVVMGLCPTVMAQTDESVDLDALYRRIDAITAEQIQQTACELFAADRLTTLIFQ